MPRCGNDFSAQANGFQILLLFDEEIGCAWLIKQTQLKPGSQQIGENAGRPQGSAGQRRIAPLKPIRF